MYDYEFAAAMGADRRAHLLAEAETARIVTTSRSEGAARGNRTRSAVGFWFRGRIAPVR